MPTQRNSKLILCQNTDTLLLSGGDLQRLADFGDFIKLPALTNHPWIYPSIWNYACLTAAGTEQVGYLLWYNFPLSWHCCFSKRSHYFNTEIGWGPDLSLKKSRGLRPVSSSAGRVLAVKADPWSPHNGRIELTPVISSDSAYMHADVHTRAHTAHHI